LRERFLFLEHHSPTQEIIMLSRYLFVLGFLSLLAGCGGGDSKATINDKPLTDAEKAAIKAEDDKVNAEEQGGKGSTTAS
jgi:hypothetical protein